MKRLTNTLMYLFIATALTFTSCSTDGEDGMDGAQGEQGIAGQDGADGQDGEDGNANVVSVLLENQTVTTGINTFSVPELTQEIYDNGLIYGYVTVSGNEFWETIPIVSFGNIILDIDRIRVGEIDIETTFDQGGLNFRFILIEGSDPNGLVDFTDYDSVADYYDLD